MKVIEDVEKLLEIDRNRLEAEKKDLIIQRAQFSVSKSN